MAKADDLYIKINANDATAKGVGSAEKRLNSLTGVAKKLTATFAGVFAVGQIVRFGKESVNLYDIQAQAEQQLLVALKDRRDVQQRLIRQAQELQGTTLYGDEETIRAQALIAAFVKEEEAIKRIIPLVQDMATAKQMSLAGAADLVSKTLGSQTNALSRYGIEVEGTVGSVERLESLMNGLNDAFGGQAAAAAETGAGAIKQLENAVGDLKEEIGELIVAGDGFSSFIKGTTKEIQDWTTILNDSSRSGFKNWMLFLLGSKKRWAEVAEEIRNTSKDYSDFLYATGMDADDTTKKQVESFISVQERVKQVNSELQAQQRILSNPNVSYEAAQEAFKTAEKLKKELKELNQILAYSTARVAAPAKMESIGTPDIKDNTPEMLHFDSESMDKATQQAREKLNKMYAEIQAEVDALNEQLTFAMANGFAAGIEAAFSGANIGGVLNAFLAPIANFLIQEGTLLVAHGVAIEAFKKSLESLNGVAAIAAGTAMIATGAAFKSFVGGGVGGGGGGGAYGGGNGYSNYQPAANANNKTQIELVGTLTAKGNDMVYQVDKNDYIIKRTLG